jgi:tetrapyrrole methylase family protein/MazG family protein
LPTQSREDLALYEIDRSQKIGLRSALYVPPLGEGTSLEAFQNVIARLRAPDGCPWDREQTHQSLRPNLLEETYEALEALDSDDPAAMCEEFGDLLLQIVLHAQIASEYGEFTLNDVFQGIYTKIVRRHPHVFQDLELEESDAVIKNWEKLKARERKMNGQVEKGLLDGVSLSLPSLTQGLTYQKRAARVGFEWDRIEGVLDKIAEEAAEIQAAVTLEEKESELGDLLFAVVNLARWLEVDAESALRGANLRFKRRFGYIEKRARELNRELSEMSLEEMDKLWDEAKDQGA